MTALDRCRLAARASGCWWLVLAAGLAAGPAHADPGSLVSFRWFTEGATSASSWASCPCPGGSVYGDCTSSPYEPAFAEGGSELVQTQLYLTAARSCGRGCTYSIGGAGGGSAIATSQPVIGDAYSSEDRTSWNFSGAIMVSAGALGTSVPCQSGGGEGESLAAQEFELVFDVTTTSRLTFSYQQWLTDQIMSAGGLVVSELRMDGPGGETLYQSALPGPEGETFEAGQVRHLVGPGRYTIRAEGTGWIIAEASGDESQSGWCSVYALAVVTLERYACVSIADHPDSAGVVPGVDASFAVSVTGESPSYAWRRDGVLLTDGPTGTGSTIIGSATAVLVVSGAGEDDEAQYDCIVTNECGSVTSDAAALSVGCPADLNDDELVDFSDYLEFLNLYDAEDPRADFNQDGLVDFSDYLEFLNHYDAGC